jgi:hypothetical protein
MPIELMGLLEDVQEYEGKNGFGANVTVSTKVGKKTKRVSFLVKDKDKASKLNELLDTDVVLKIELNQNNFGLRFGELLEIGA